MPQRPNPRDVTTSENDDDGAEQRAATERLTTLRTRLTPPV